MSDESKINIRPRSRAETARVGPGATTGIAELLVRAERREAQWRAVVESMSEGLVIADAAGNLIDWNRSAMLMHGFDVDDIDELRKQLETFPQRFDLSVDGRSLPLDEWPMSRVLRGEDFVDMEIDVRRLDRPIELIVSYSGRAVRDRAGQIVLAMLTLHDVTVERRAQRALRDHADRLSLALAAARLGDWEWDAATDVMKLSDRACEIFGVSNHGPHIRTIMRDSLHPDDRERARLASEQAAADRSEYDIEYRVIRPDGSLVWVAAKGRGVHDEQGRLLRMLGVVQDITRRKEDEESLRISAMELLETNRRLRLAQEAGRIGVFDWSIAEGTIFWSPELEKLYDMPAGSFEGNFDAWQKRVVPEDVERVEASVAHAIAAKSGTHRYEFRAILPGGGTRSLVGLAYFFYDDSGNATRMVGVNVDNTEQQRLTEVRERLLAAERAAREAAEHASQMKDEFLATLSHELRTPLNAILGWSQILRLNAGDPTDLSNGLETIERNAKAQSQIIEDLLDMSRIISGKLRLHVQTMDCIALVKSSIDTLAPAANAKGVSLSMNLETNEARISGDPDRLQQILWNLLSNAVKFTPQLGKVDVRVSLDDSHVTIAVADTGQGIAADFLPHVFDRFRQADASTTRSAGGLGLGLSIVKQLVELHGGTIDATSGGLDQGSRFTVRLPIQARSALDDVPNLSPSAALTSTPIRDDRLIEGVKVLVVDDEPDARLLVQRVLQEHGAKVTTVASAGEAMRQIAANLPDLLISDIAMPGEDGYALIRQVRALKGFPAADVPALALTAYARSEDRTRSIRAGYQMHASKPIEPAELIAIVASLARPRNSLN